MLQYEPRRSRNIGIVAGHGYSSSKHNMRFSLRFLSAHGFRVYSLDFPGTNSARAAANWAASTIASAAMQRVVALARERSNDPVYTLGHSMGGMTAIFTAALDETIAGVVAIATGYGRPTSIETLQKVGVTDFRASYVVGVTLPELVAGVGERYDALLPRLAGRQQLYVAASRDAMVSPRSVQELYDRAPDPKTFRHHRKRSHLRRRELARDRVAMVQRTLNAQALRRYSRHLLIPEVGLRGQERLTASRVLVIGAGGLGSPSLQYLAAAGVGTIGIVDDDVVDETNLQRQTIFRTEDVGVSKAIAAAARLHALNPLVEVLPYAIRFEPSNARAMVRHYDVVLDCTDRFPTRYCINDACYFERKPDVYGSIFRFDGQVSVFAGQPGPCYRCLYPEPPPAELTPTCSEGGVLGAIAGIVGTWQAS